MILYHDPPNDEIIYSTFLRNGFLLLGKNDVLNDLLERPDLDVEVATDRSLVWTEQEKADCLILTDAGDSIAILGGKERHR